MNSLHWNGVGSSTMVTKSDRVTFFAFVTLLTGRANHLRRGYDGSPSQKALRCQNREPRMHMVSGAVLERWTGLSDEDIVSRVVQGQTALFEVLMRRHNERIYRAARA